MGARVFTDGAWRALETAQHAGNAVDNIFSWHDGAWHRWLDDLLPEPVPPTALTSVSGVVSQHAILDGVSPARFDVSWALEGEVVEHEIRVHRWVSADPTWRMAGTFTAKTGNTKVMDNVPDGYSNVPDGYSSTVSVQYRVRVVNKQTNTVVFTGTTAQLGMIVSGSVGYVDPGGDDGTGGPSGGTGDGAGSGDDGTIQME